MMNLANNEPSRLHFSIASLLVCCRWVAAIASLLAVQAVTACAQDADGGAVEEGKSYGIPWLIIVLVVALGVFITLRPSGRSSEIKRDPRADL